MAFSLPHLPLLRAAPPLPFLYFAGERLKGKVVCGEGVIFKSSEVSNFHNWVVITDGRVFRSRQEPPHTAEMYICNLFVAYFVFSPVYANKAIFNPPPFCCSWY